MEERIISKSQVRLRKVASNDKNSDLECYDRSEGKLVYVGVDKEMAEISKPTLVLVPNRSEEDEINNNDETRDRDGNINLRRSNRIIKPLERLGSAPYF